MQDGTLFQVRAVYTYLPLHDDEMSIKPNDIINVIRVVCLKTKIFFFRMSCYVQAEEGWYEGILDGKQGLFPSNYVTRIHDEKQKANQSTKQKPVSGLRTLVKNEATKKSPTIKARVLYNYKATASDELSLTVNDIITVLDKNLDDEGWWKGELNGCIGVFPGQISCCCYLLSCNVFRCSFFCTDNYVEEISSTTVKEKQSFLTRKKDINFLLDCQTTTAHT